MVMLRLQAKNKSVVQKKGKKPCFTYNQAVYMLDWTCLRTGFEEQQKLQSKTIA